MAIDLVVRPDAGWLTLVHDDPELEIDGLLVMEDGSVFRTGSDGSGLVGKLAPSMQRDVSACTMAAVVRMHGDRVADTVQVGFVNRIRRQQE